jgi:hypothetical protein
VEEKPDQRGRGAGGGVRSWIRGEGQVRPERPEQSRKSTMRKNKQEEE